MKTDSIGREKEIANFCTDLSVIWRKYASDRPFQSFIGLFEWELENHNLSRKFALDDIEYIEKIREFYENK